jgi:hypothetical protein
MNEEVWKDVLGYEGYYQISNLGNLKSLDRWVYSNRGGYRLSKGINIKPDISKKGYLVTHLSKENKRKRKSIHRLVAETFLENHESKATVNHINGIKSDNRLENLEWHTQKENLAHALNTGLRKLAYSCKRVFDQCTQRYYDSVKEASIAIGISVHQASRWIKKGHCLHALA